MNRTRDEQVFNAARNLARELLELDRYGGDSPLKSYVRQHVERMADEIASTAVAGMPELRELLEKEVHAILTKILASNVEVNRFVVDSVSRAMAEHARKAEDDE